MNPKYSPSFDFLRIRDKDNDKHYEDRLVSLMETHQLTEQQSILILLRIDIELSMEFDASPFTRKTYTRKVDEYVDEFLSEDNDIVRNLLARISETIVLEEYI